MRESCGLVLQEPFLFDMTIAENISYGVPSHMSRSQTRIEEAAKLANAHDFIMELPDVTYYPPLDDILGPTH